MIIYSQKIVLFLKTIKQFLKKILREEAGLKVTGERFFDARQVFSYPLSVVIYSDRQQLGYFNAEFLELGFHERLLFASMSDLQDIIRHELAHYLTFIKYGTVSAHGWEFKQTCLELGWGERVYKATIQLEENQETVENNILRKIQKLMALSASNNTHEAEQAMIKSQQLLLKHNLESCSASETNEEKFYLKRILKQARKTAKLQAIAKILESFFVNIIYTRASGAIYLEILGSKVNIEIADYVANFLNNELERLWNFACQQFSHLRGRVAKNSFFLGIAKGYCQKMHSLQKEYGSGVQQGLIVLEKKLQSAEKLVYRRLRKSSSSQLYCPTSATIGQTMGKQLTINAAINQSGSSKLSEKKLSYQKGE